MANATTCASVALRLTDADIGGYSRVVELCTNLLPESKSNIAAVLRDYVRMRRLENAIKNVADSVNECHSDSEYFSAMNEIKDILAEAEKGEAK